MKSTIHIAADALRSNLRAIQAVAGADYDIFCILKANAYGHGIALCAPVLVEAGAKWLGVADLDEAILLRSTLLRAGLADRPVHLVTMCGFEPEDAPALVEHNLTPVVWTPAHIQALEHAAAPLHQRVAVHIEIDTGMARQGAAPGADLAALLEALRSAPHVRAEGVFSHLTSSEMAGSPLTTHQLTRLGPALEQLAEHEVMPEYLHLGNSSAADEGSTLGWIRDFALNDLSATPLLRPGLALYGYTLPLTADPAVPHLAAGPNLAPALTPVATWTTRILYLRDLHPGDTVGYGSTFVAPEAMRVALLPVGYADGFRREASSGVGDGWVFIAGQPAPVVGRVSMNLMVVDVSEITPTPNVEDEVVLLGPGVTAHDHAHWCDTIAYEIICGMRGHHHLA